LKNRDLFIDAMGGIDEDLLTAHIQKKHPTRAQKVRKYSSVAAIYVAACLVIMLVIPFVIGKEAPVKPPVESDIVPGVIPENTESDMPMNTDDYISENNEPGVVPETEDGTEAIHKVEFPTATVSFLGCDFTITLDREGPYTLDDTIIATVTLVNNGDKPVGLWQGYLGDFLDEIRFFEDGEVRWSYSSEWDRGYPEACQWGPFEPSGSITHVVEFTPGTPNDTSDPVASTDSHWEITASVAYYEYVEGDADDVFERVQTATVTVEVPHEGRDAGTTDTDDTDETTEQVDTYETEPKDTEPEETTPVTIDTCVTEPEDTEPEETTPVTVDVQSTEPEEIVTDTTEPVTSEPVETEPEDTEEIVTESEEPVTSESEAAEPEEEPEPVECPVPTGITVGIGGKTVKVRASSAEFEKISALAGEMIASSKSLWYDVSPSSVDGLRNYGVFAELVYDSGEFSASGDTIPGVKRVFIDLVGYNVEHNYVMLSDSDDYLGEIYEYTADIPYELADLISGLVHGKDPVMAQKTFDGCTYSVILDKVSYTVDDRVTATMILKNTSDKPITLFNAVYANYLSDIMLWVDGKEVPYYIDGEMGMTRYGVLEPGEAVVHRMFFDMDGFDPYDTWELRSIYKYYLGIVDSTTDENYEMKTGKLTIEIPHKDVEKFVSYPEPSITGQTVKSVTKTMFGCEYTVSLNKTKYMKGENITVVVTLENKGETTMYFKGENENHVLDDVSFDEGGIVIVGKGDWEEPIGSLRPGETISYTVKFHSGKADISNPWTITASLDFAVYGTHYTENIQINVPH